jgi:hypothetical protein
VPVPEAAKETRMKPRAVITRRVHACTRDLLSIRAEVVAHAHWEPMPRPELANHIPDARALLLFPPDRIDEAMLAMAPQLRVVACAFLLPENIDVAGCTRRGIWVANVAHSRFSGGYDIEYELEAARNILEVLNGDIPRGAVNQVRLACAT